MERHLLTASVGAGLTTLLYLVLRRVERAPIVARLITALVLALPAAGLLSLVNYEFLYVLARDAIWPATSKAQVLRGIFAGWLIAMLVWMRAASRSM